MGRNKEIVARMLGGLGNQLFIYSYARFLQKQISDYTEICFELSSYKSNSFNSFDIINLPLSKRVKMLNPREKRFFLIITSELFRRVDYVIRKITHGKIDLFGSSLRKFGLYYTRIKAHQLLNQPRKNLYLYGYFQNTFFLDDMKEELQNEAILPTNSLSNSAKSILELITSSNNSIAVSIRCLEGYALGGFHVYKSIYYQKGIRYLMNSQNSSDIFVFADDISKVKDSFGLDQFGKIVYVEGCDACEQLTLMSHCNNFVIANSSFSWWGAYLSSNTEKKVIAPNIWWKDIKTSDFGIQTPNMVLIDE